MAHLVSPTDVMHGPDGTHHPNASVFREVQAPSTTVIEHASPPHFVLTVTLTPQHGRTALACDAYSRAGIGAPARWGARN